MECVPFEYGRLGGKQAPGKAETGNEFYDLGQSHVFS
jgi:hypothetical protein